MKRVIIVKAVIFDLDGTLLDTIGDLAAAVNFALKANNLDELPLEVIKGYVGNGARLLIERSSGHKAGSPVFEKCFNAFSVYYNSHLRVYTKPYEGICEVLRELKKRGIMTAVLSNKPHRASKALIKAYFENLIDLAIGERAGVPKKPDPTGAFEAMEELGVKAGDALYVGDSEVDIQTGRNAGLKTLSCLWGFKTRDFLVENGAEALIEKPEDILDFL